MRKRRKFRTCASGFNANHNEACCKFFDEDGRVRRKSPGGLSERTRVKIRLAGYIEQHYLEHVMHFRREWTLEHGKASVGATMNGICPGKFQGITQHGI